MSRAHGAKSPEVVTMSRLTLALDFSAASTPAEVVVRELQQWLLLEFGVRVREQRLDECTVEAKHPGHATFQRLMPGDLEVHARDPQS